MTVEPSCPATPSGRGKWPARSQMTRPVVKVAAMIRLAVTTRRARVAQAEESRRVEHGGVSGDLVAGHWPQSNGAAVVADRDQPCLMVSGWSPPPLGDWNANDGWCLAVHGRNGL